MRRSTRFIALTCAALLSLSAQGAALIESLSGSVRAGPTADSATAASRNQRVLPGSVVTTGANSQALLRFDDGQTIALAANSEFKVAAYSFARETPAGDSFVFELLRGALRSVSGLVGRRNPGAYVLRTPQATIGIRGTDFMVALINPAFVSVTSGSITATNAAGTAAFGAGATGTVASATALGAAIPASALPASVSATFNQLGSLALTAGAGATPGAAEAAGAASGGISAGVVAGVAAAAAGLAAAASSDKSNGTAGTTGTTGTR